MYFTYFTEVLYLLYLGADSRKELLQCPDDNPPGSFCLSFFSIFLQCPDDNPLGLSEEVLKLFV